MEPQPGKTGQEIFGDDWSWVRFIFGYRNFTAEKRCTEMLKNADTRRRDGEWQETNADIFSIMLQSFVKEEKETCLAGPDKGEALGRGSRLHADALFTDGSPPNLGEIPGPVLLVS